MLEAVFVVCLGRSQRSAPDSVMIQTDASYFRIEAGIKTRQQLCQATIAYERGGRKKIAIDGVTAKARELYEQFCVVSSGPEDSSIVSGPPSVRRNFLNVYISQLSSRYLSDLTDYHKALAQKNAALRNNMDPAPFDPQVIAYGARVTQARSAFLSDLGSAAATYYRMISDDEQLHVAYKPSVAVAEEHSDLVDIETAFRVRVEDSLERERVLQTALVGPHRDEVQFDIGGQPARSHGSQGQWRTAAVSLKLAVYGLLKEKRGMAPLLLLDEVFAELDDRRVDALVGALDGFSQLFLTTAQDPPEALLASGRSYRLASGRIEEIL